MRNTLALVASGLATRSGDIRAVRARLAEKLKETAPVPISKVFYGASGSDANDTQIKLVWYMNNALGRPHKKKIIARLKGYHGVTVASASLTGPPNNHIDLDLPLPGILHTSCPHHCRFGQVGESEQDFSTRMAAEPELSCPDALPVLRGNQSFEGRATTALHSISDGYRPVDRLDSDC